MRIDISSLAFLVSCLLVTTPLQATDPLAGRDHLSLPLFHSQVITLDTPASRVSVGNPEIADIVMLGNKEFYVLAKDIGRTNILVWEKGSTARDAMVVEVTHDLPALRRKLHDLIPEQKIEVHSAQDSIVLTGTVPSAAAMAAALRIAEGFLAPGALRKDGPPEQEETAEGPQHQASIVNLLEIAGAQQVMLEVKVAEIARTEFKRLQPRFNAFGRQGLWNYGGVNGGATFPDALFGTEGLRSPVFAGGAAGSAGPVIDEFAPNDLVIQNQGIFAGYLSDSFFFNLALDVAKEKGLARILAEPTLTTLTGQPASFLSGGEFPVPVPSGLDNVTIEFKDFGIGLNVLPVVLSDGRINVRLDVAVSELSNATSVLLSPRNSSSTFVVPSLTKRSASGTVELADGQTIGLAGLINDTTRSTVEKFPGLGSLPVLGALFRSQQFLTGQSELIILVTPRLAKPVDPQRMTLPTDGYLPADEIDFYLLGRDEAPESSKEAVGATRDWIEKQTYDVGASDRHGTEAPLGTDPDVATKAINDLKQGKQPAQSPAGPNTIQLPSFGTILGTK
jgi:pilus assembly protein CpaC